MLRTFHVAVSKHFTIPLVFLTLFRFNLMISLVELVLCPLESEPPARPSPAPNSEWQSRNHVCFHIVVRANFNFGKAQCPTPVLQRKMTVDWNSLHVFVKGQQGVTWSQCAVLSCENSYKLFVQVVGWMTCYYHRHLVLGLCCISSCRRCCDALDSEFLDGCILQMSSVWWSMQ